MTQEAIVTQTFPNNMAEVSVTRMTACGGDCGSCESCITQGELKTLARNLVKATPGQKVIIESKSSLIMRAVFLVYVMPLVLFLAGYGIAAALGAAEGLCIICSFLGLILGGVLVVLSQKRKNKKQLNYDIIKLL